MHFNPRVTVGSAFATRSLDQERSASADARAAALDLAEVPDARLQDALRTLDVPVHDGTTFDPHATPHSADQVRAFCSWWQNQRSMPHIRFELACQHLLEFRCDEAVVFGAIELHRQGVITLRVADDDADSSASLLHHLARFATTDTFDDFALNSGSPPRDDAARIESMSRVFERLIAAGFDPHARETRSSRLGQARAGGERQESWTRSLLGSAIAQGNDATTRVLIDLGVSVDDIAATCTRRRHARPHENAHFNALQLAGEHGRHDIAVLIAKHVGLRSSPRRQVEPLHDAAQYGLVGAIETLLERGLPIDTPNTLGERALDIAVQHDRADAVRTLLERGAAVNIVDHDDVLIASPLAIAAHRDESIALLILQAPNIQIHDGEGICPALEGALSKKFERLTAALLERGAQADYRLVDYGITTHDYFPLRDAILSQRLSLVRLGPDRDVDVHATDSAGYQAIHHAAKTNNGPALQALVARGAQVNRRVHEDADNDGDTDMTPLQLAIRHAHADAVRALIEAGADACAIYRRSTVDESTGRRRNDFENCIDLAYRTGDDAIIDLVEQRWLEQSLANIAF